METVKTVWIRNVETGSVFELEEGEALDYKLAEQNSDGERVYEKVSAPGSRSRRSQEPAEEPAEEPKSKGKKGA